MTHLLKFTAAVLILIPTQWALAAGGPKFKVPAPGVVALPNATANQPYDLDLRTLLSNQGAPPLTWIVTGLPGWLKLDAANNRVSGNPTGADAGSANFTIGVRDDEGGDINRKAQITVTAPPIWKFSTLDLGLQNEDSPWSFDLNTVVTNPAGGAMTFSATSLPKWMNLDTTSGILAGTPRRDDVGKYSGISFTATGKGGSSSISAFGEVLITIKPPKWTSKEITLPDGKEDTSYNQPTNGFVSNPEGAELTFEIVSATPPPWIQIGATSGELFGTPKKPNVGSIAVSVILRGTINGKTYDDTTTFRFNVQPTNHAPYWLSSLITLPSGKTKVPYTQPLGSSAKDPDNDKLTFKIESYNGPGTNWAQIDPNTGEFRGTPEKPNVGKNSWVVSVTDPGGLSATTTVEMTVIKSNEPPYWLANPTLLPEAREDFSYEVDLTKYVEDPDKDSVTFTKLDGPAWFSISSSGKLMGTPKAQDIGVNRFNVRVSDNISGNAVAEIQILVTHTNHAPYWVIKPILISVNEDSPMKENISVYAKDDDIPVPGDKLVFSSLEGPNWATLSSDGVFTGKPTMENEGDNNFKVRVEDQAGLGAEVMVVIKVLHVNHKPYWTQDPIVLPNAKEDAPYSSSIAEFGKDPDKNDSLTFSKISGLPAWVTIGSNGSVGGTPARANVGVNEFKVRVMDQNNEFADATVRITVEKVNKPPRWRQNPILMTDAYEDTTYSFDLAPYAVDDDGDVLAFKMIDGPKWIFVNTNGSIKGVPMKADLGTFEATFEVSDGQASAITKGRVTVIHKNHPPVISPTLPIFEVLERDTKIIGLNDPKYVSDPDGDKLNFRLDEVNPPEWLKLSSTGELTLDKPKYKDIGDHQFRFKVDDGQIPVYGTLKIRVLRNPRPPVWLEDPISLTAKTNENFSGDISSKAKDLDGISLTFSKVSGNAWLSVTANGGLSGIPRDPDLGENTFIIKACNDKLCAQATLKIKVIPGTQIETIQIDQAVAGAKTENVWLVDNSSVCDKTIKALKANIKVYFDALKSLGISHSTVYLSADAHKFDGLPIRDQDQPMLLTSENPNPSADFNRRLDASFSSGSCGNCNNSPIWAFYRFLERAPELSEIYHNGFFMEHVPTDAMIVTHQRDHYKYFTKNNQELKNYTPADFAKDYLDFYQGQRQSLRFSAIAPACPKLVEATGNESLTGPENAYKVVVDKTSGKYYATTCDFNMVNVLKEYAQKVAFRAYVHAKHRIKLSKTPLSQNTIKVFVGGVEIPGNSGSTIDKWRYDEQTNEVVIDWYLIDQGQLKPGDQIRIEYRVS